MGDPGRWGGGVPNIHNGCKTTAAQPVNNHAVSRQQLTFGWPFVPHTR